MGRFSTSDQNRTLDDLMVGRASSEVSIDHLSGVMCVTLDDKSEVDVDLDGSIVRDTRG